MNEGGGTGKGRWREREREEGKDSVKKRRGREKGGERKRKGGRERKGVETKGWLCVYYDDVLSLYSPIILYLLCKLALRRTMNVLKTPTLK